MKVFVSPLEKDYVFEAMDKVGIDYEKKEFTIYYCDECNKIFREKPEKCCGDLKSMSIGDIIGEKLNYIIERKKGSDLLHSLKDDRIYLQLQSMKEIFSGNVALVFEGSFEKVAKKERERVKQTIKEKSQARKAFAACEARIAQMYSIPAHCLSLGISFIQVDDIFTLLKMLKYFDYKCGEAPKIREKKEDISKLMPSLIKKLMTTPGIGSKLASAIFNFAKTPNEFLELLKTNYKKILSIDGLGKKKLQNIMEDWL